MTLLTKGRDFLPQTSRFITEMRLTTLWKKHHSV